MARTLEIAIFNGNGIVPEIMAFPIAIQQSRGNQVHVGAAQNPETGESLAGKCLPSVGSSGCAKITPQIGLRKPLSLVVGLCPMRIAFGQQPVLTGDLGGTESTVKAATAVMARM